MPVSTEASPCVGNGLAEVRQTSLGCVQIVGFCHCVALLGIGTFQEHVVEQVEWCPLNRELYPSPWNLLADYLNYWGWTVRLLLIYFLVLRIEPRSLNH